MSESDRRSASDRIQQPCGIFHREREGFGGGGGVGGGGRGRVLRESERAHQTLKTRRDEDLVIHAKIVEYNN